MQQPAGDVRARAEALLELGRHTEAERLLGQLLGTHPDDARAHCLLALALDGQRRDQEMLAAANRAVALAPDDEWGHRIASIALVRLGMREEAARAAAEAVRLDPLGWRTHLQYAVVAHDLPRLAQDAHAAALRAAEIAPEQADVHFALGLTADATGRHEEVEDHYRDAIRLDPSHAGALNNLAVSERDLHLGRKARGYLAALRANPDAHFARANLEGLVGRFGVRVLALAGLAVLVCAAAGASGAPEPGPSLVRSLAGVLLLFVVVTYSRSLLRQLPPGARTYLWSRVRRDSALLVGSLVTVLGLVLALVVCFTPVGGGLALGLLRPLAIFTVVTVVRVAVRRAR